MMIGSKSLALLSRAAALALLLGIVAVAGLLALAGPATASASTTNVVANPGFEAGVAPWVCKNCALTTGTPAYSGAAAGQLRTTKRDARAQLYQNNVRLQPRTQYQITFWARSGGQDLQLDLIKQVSPFTNYGLNQTFDVTNEWRQFSATFTTAGFNSAISNARLRFRAPKGSGFQYSIDDISLVAVDAPPPTPSPTPSPTPPPSGGAEMLVFDWNKEVTEAQSGFPWDKPPLANGNWITPINYAEGTFYLRAEVRSIPVNQDDMKVQFCIWQDSSRLENCTRTVDVPGRAGTVVEWSVGVQNLWKKNGVIIDWSRARHRNGFAIKNGAGDPVSDYSGWNWNGENPEHWYPMNARFTVVVVAKGQTFSGWDTYIAP